MSEMRVEEKKFRMSEIYNNGDVAPKIIGILEIQQFRNA